MGARPTRPRELLGELLRAPNDGATVVVEGPAGIGKTTLVQECLRDVDGAVRVVSERCDPLTAHQPFASVSALLDEADRAADPREAAYLQVDSWCSASPVVLWVDDAQYADAGSLAVLSRLWSATAVLPLIVILSVRPEPRRAELAALIDEATDRVLVPPLDDADIDVIVRRQLGGAPGPILREQLEVAAGNPFALGVLLGLLERRGAIRRDGDHVDVDPGDRRVPRSVHVMVRAYLDQLSAGAVELATTVAALGSPADPLDVAAMLRRPVAALNAPAAEVTEAGVLHWRAGALVLGHDLYGETLLAGLALPLRQALHRDAARVLRDREAPDAQVAEQLLQAGDTESLRHVAAANLRTAPGVAADLLDHVQPRPSTGDAGQLTVQRATALFLAGRGREAEDLVHTQLPPRTADPQIRAQMRAVALRSMVNRANASAALDEIENLLADPHLPTPSGLVLRQARAWVLLLGGDLRAAEAAVGDASAFAAASGHDAASEVARTTRACLALLRCRPDQALEIVPVGEDRATLDPLSNEPTFTVWPPFFVLLADGPDAARRASARAREVSAQHGADWLTPFHDWVSAGTDWTSGDWDDAIAGFDAGLARAGETGTGWTSMAVGVRALVLAHRGQLDRARSELADFDRRCLPAQFGLDYSALTHLAADEAAAVVRYRAESTERVWRAAFEPVQHTAAELWRRACAGGGLLWMMIVGPYVARIGDDALRRDVAGAVADADLSRTRDLPLVRQHLEGLSRQDHAAMADAAAGLERHGTVREAAFAYEEAGLLAARTGNTAAAGRELRSASDLYLRLQASSDLDRLRARAHRLGVRTSSSVPRRRPATGWEALTPTERTVAGLVHRGLTNPDIARQLYLSPRTVQTHVSHILQKTGLRSRVDVAAVFVPLIRRPYARPVNRLPLEVARLRAELPPPWTAITVHDEVDSTNRAVLADPTGFPACSVLVAEHQVAGRGRLDRTWVTPARSALTFSTVLVPNAPRVRWGWLPLLAGLAVCDAVRTLTGVPAALKWPNDVLAGADGGKLAGVLVQASGRRAVVGIGLNVSTTPQELPVDNATSLSQAGADVDRTTLLLAVLGRLGTEYQNWEAGAPGLADRYRDHCATLGRVVTVTDVAGHRTIGPAVDIDPDGRLVLAVGGRRQTVAAGDVQHVRAVPAAGDSG